MAQVFTIAFDMHQAPRLASAASSPPRFIRGLTIQVRVAASACLSGRGEYFSIEAERDGKTERERERVRTYRERRPTKIELLSTPIYTYIYKASLLLGST